MALNWPVTLAPASDATGSVSSGLDEPRPAVAPEAREPAGLAYGWPARSALVFSVRGIGVA